MLLWPSSSVICSQNRILCDIMLLNFAICCGTCIDMQSCLEEILLVLAGLDKVIGSKEKKNKTNKKKKQVLYMCEGWP